MLLLGSCLALNLSYSGCCVSSLSPTCGNNGCYCDDICHNYGDCCSDVVDIGCHPVSPSSSTVLFTSAYTFGKAKLDFTAILVTVWRKWSNIKDMRTKERVFLDRQLSHWVSYEIMVISLNAKMLQVVPLEQRGIFVIICVVLSINWKHFVISITFS